MKQLVFDVTQVRDPQTRKYNGPGELTLQRVPDVSCDRVVAMLLWAGLQTGVMPDPSIMWKSTGFFYTPALYNRLENRSDIGLLTKDWLGSKQTNHLLRPFVVPSITMAKRLLQSDIPGGIAFSIAHTNRALNSHQYFINQDLLEIDSESGYKKMMSQMRKPCGFIRGSHGDKELKRGTKSFFVRQPWEESTLSDPNYFGRLSEVTITQKELSGGKYSVTFRSAENKEPIISFISPERIETAEDYFSTYPRFTHVHIDGRADNGSRAANKSILIGWFAEEGLYQDYQLQDAE